HLEQNPHNSWMRLSGVDFFADGKRAAVCTWMGDVWIVEGINQSEGTLTWKRICSGLFQPLGLRILDEKIHVTCRDQLAKLHDTNGDETIDFIECLNNDHQVTEHFHEFAMGLQTDAEGNFYYAKSARHAKDSLVPHHGTLLKVAADGSRTDILATGFRAANGVCLNPDGSFIVTDQEGHWNPKNRINWVKGDGPTEFFGNIYGYSPVTDPADSAMSNPLCWITNQFDRSPSELLWVPKNANWGPLNGQLLNLSYGYGKIFIVPHEEIKGQHQGGMCELPLKQFPTGIMRGRFHPKDGQLYGCGMFAWGGNQRKPGGFYRIRKTDQPAHLPTKIETTKAGIKITLSDKIDPPSVKPENFTIKVWGLKRSQNYGSKHLNEQELKVTAAQIEGTKIHLTLPKLQPTWGMSIEMTLSDQTGKTFTRLIHNSIFDLPK
ncbi:MAG: heme-binding protein, partial [Akkermansiaceae bacterium]